jgi:hypothetical protein
MITKAQLTALGEQLIVLAATFSPKNAEAIESLVKVGTQLNNVIHDIRDQTDEDAQAVWETVKTNAEDAIAEYQASVEQHTG